ncbi:MAG: hypothetical protein WC405_19740 [Syntrophales bacterium]
MQTKRILLRLTLVAVLSLVVLSAGAQEKKPEGAEEKKGIPSGEVTIKVTQAAAGLGVTWGDGTLTFKGKDYKFKVSGLSLIAVGFTSTNAKGEVYNLQKLSDFPGKYFGVEAGATLIKGSAGLVLRNTQGVVLNLKSEQKGASLRLGNEGLSISAAWE